MNAARNHWENSGGDGSHAEAIAPDSALGGADRPGETGSTQQEVPPDSFFAAAHAHLRRLGLVADDAVPTWRLLAGGISNWVVLFDCGDGVVVKGALARLRVPEPWLADPARAVSEGRAMTELGARLPLGDMPRILFVDERASLLGMTRAPEAAEPWKQALLRGDVATHIAHEAGRVLGRMHRAAWDDTGLATQFRDLSLFRQLRLDPYHERAAVTAEERGEHELAGLLRAGAEAMTLHRRTLVHGDYSPKNLLVYDRHVMALDFEVVHWGNPDFDTAFMLTHLALKSIYRPAAAESLARAARAFLEGYESAVEVRDSAAIAAGALQQAGCLLCARADGKSRAEYLDALGFARARALGAAVLRGSITDIESLFRNVEET